MSKKIVIIRNAAQYDFGGGERFPVLLAQELENNNYQSIIFSRNKKLLEFAAQKNIQTIASPWWSWQNMSGLRKLLFPLYLVWLVLLFVYYLVLFARIRPEVVHIQSKDDFVSASLAGKIIKARIVWTDHADLKHIFQNVELPLRNPMGKLVLWTSTFADVITVVSESERRLVTDELNRHGAVVDKITVVYNGAYDELTEKHGTTNAVPKALVASRLVTDKGIGEIIEAVISINKEKPSLLLDIIGDGPESKQFHELAAGNKEISFHGHQNHPVEWMKQTDMFIHATYHEGFSLALVEACMMQLPIIATEVGGNPEIIIDGVTGLLIPPHNSRAIEDAIHRLLNDPSLRSTIADSARQSYVDKFQFDKIVKEKFIPIYEKTTN
ncbi:MAG: glycosyltransferase family 4 protein [Candidatus Saccharimonadales bacterium]